MITDSFSAVISMVLITVNLHFITTAKNTNCFVLCALGLRHKIVLLKITKP